MVDWKDYQIGDGPVCDAEPTPDHQPEAEADMAPSKSNRSPAFQFYPESWLSSSKVQRMSHTERGMYMDLLSHCWLDNGLPSQIRHLASLLHVSLKRFERIWTSGPLHECFHERGGRLHNQRLDVERKKQAEFRAKQAENGAKGGRGHKKAMGLSGLTQTEAKESSLSLISIPNSVSNKDKEDSSPILLTFPVIGNPSAPTWDLRQSLVTKLEAAYPQFDVLDEARRALAWVETNQPKTARGMPAFLNRWLGNAANRGPTVSRPVRSLDPRRNPDPWGESWSCTHEPACQTKEAHHEKLSEERMQYFLKKTGQA